MEDDEDMEDMDLMTSLQEAFGKAPTAASKRLQESLSYTISWSHGKATPWKRALGEHLGSLVFLVPSKMFSFPCFTVF